MSKSQASAVIHPNPDGSVAIQYVPKQNGAHDLSVNCNDIPVAGKSQPISAIGLITLTETICFLPIPHASFSQKNVFWTYRLFLLIFFQRDCHDILQKCFKIQTSV